MSDAQPPEQTMSDGDQQRERGTDSAQMANYARAPVEFVRGEGARLWDVDGAEYLDFLSGISVLNVGHSHPAVVAAVKSQVERLAHVSNLFWSAPAERLARRLSDLSIGGKVFFCNSGAEANEAAIKLARARAFRAGRQGREILVLEGAFHGRTLGALSATPDEAKQAPFAPLVAGFVTAPNNDAGAVDALIGEQTAAVLIEPIQGETGVHLIPDAVLEAARVGCDRVGAMLIFDEIQTGLARTGSLWAYQQTPVRPDAITLAKSLGGGLPIGALVAADPFHLELRPGDHGSTFGGGPVVCAAANAALDVLTEDGLAERVTELGERLRGGLTRIGEPRGRGLMVAVELPSGVDARAVARRALLEQRLIVNATGASTLRLLPPLTIGAADVDDCVERLVSVL